MLFVLKISVKDAYVRDLEHNLTYYKSAYTASEKALINIRALENFLQNQVSQNTFKNLGPVV